MRKSLLPSVKQIPGNLYTSVLLLNGYSGVCILTAPGPAFAARVAVGTAPTFGRWAGDCTSIPAPSRASSASRDRARASWAAGPGSAACTGRAEGFRGSAVFSAVSMRGVR